MLNVSDPLFREKVLKKIFFRDLDYQLSLSLTEHLHAPHQDVVPTLIITNYYDFIPNSTFIIIEDLSL